MKTIKVMSIIGIIWFSIMFLGMVGSDYDDAGGFGAFAILYAIPYSIVCLVQANRMKKMIIDKSA